MANKDQIIESLYKRIETLEEENANLHDTIEILLRRISELGGKQSDSSDSLSTSPSASQLSVSSWSGDEESLLKFIETDQLSSLTSALKSGLNLDYRFQSRDSCNLYFRLNSRSNSLQRNKDPKLSLQYKYQPRIPHF
jgi:hypothetical protein